MAKATAYLIVEATRSTWVRPDPETGLRRIDSARIIAVRANRPSLLKLDQIAVKVTVDIPDEAFAPIMPTALVVVPEDLVQRPVVDDAQDATEGADDE